MSIKRLLFVLITHFSILNFTSNANNVQTRLVMVQVVFRSGIRSPHSIYPNDKIPLSHWDKYGGVGQLTNVGMKQMHKFGNHFRTLYQFLNRTYDRKRVFVRASEKDRTIQSCLVFLTGLYGPNSDQRWTKATNLTGYMPIPVHTNDLHTDQIFHAASVCERYDYLRSEARNSAEWLKMEHSYKNFLIKMANYSGLNLVDNLYDIWHLADNILVYEVHGIKLPKWATDNYHTIMHMKDKTFYVDFSTMEMAKLISGGLLNNIIQNIKNKVNGSSYELFLYGANEEYLVGLQKLLQNLPSTNLISPHFGSAFIFELRIDAYGQYYIQILFKNNNYPAPFKATPININGCDIMCPLNDFLRLTYDKLVTDFEESCILLDE